MPVKGPSQATRWFWWSFITCSVSWTMPILFYRCSLDLLFSPTNLQGLGRSSPNFATCLTVTQIYKNCSEIRWPLPLKFGGSEASKFRRDFAPLRDLIANISNKTQQDIVGRKTALQTTDTPTQANLIWCTLVQKWRKIGLEFWPTQWAAIRLGIAI